MIRSMTGFASVSRAEGADAVAVTVKAVNHRFLDLALKMPSALGAIEPRLRALVQQKLARGRVELVISAETTGTTEREVVIDEALIERVAAALEPARARGLLTGGLTASDVLRIPQAVDIRVKSPAEDGPSASLAALAERAVAEALDALVAMRETEGRFTAADLDARLRTLHDLADAIARASADGQAALAARLRDRVAALPAEIALDPSALAQEIVRFVARSDIDEELARLRGHVEHWGALAGGADPCGRKLDFLVQEMNREINTIGSKVEGGRATELVVAAKAELERIREQVQNVE